jgi:hypothetical protein
VKDDITTTDTTAKASDGTRAKNFAKTEILITANDRAHDDL